MRASWLESSPKGEGDVDGKSRMLSGLDEKSCSLFYKGMCLNMVCSVSTQWFTYNNKGSVTHNFTSRNGTGYFQPRMPVTFLRQN